MIHTLHSTSQFESHHTFSVPDRSYAGIVKRDITKLVETWGFDEVVRGKIDIIISELTSNLVKHKALNGQILVKRIEQEGRLGIEILCLDNGPGMHDPQRMMQDGVSTFGSAGQGIGAIKRLSEDFDLYSQWGVGTVLLSRLFEKTSKPSKTKGAIDIKVVCVPKKGESVSGDAWGFKQKDTCYFILAADGLGHGPDANFAGISAVEAFLQTDEESPGVLLKQLHAAIKRSRGAVCAVAKIDVEAKSLTYCGVGNISSKLVEKDAPKNIISYNGTVGLNVPTHLNDHTYTWNTHNMLIMHSDGIKSRWDMAKYNGIEKHDGAVIAGLIYKDNERGTDDCLVIVVK